MTKSSRHIIRQQVLEVATRKAGTHTPQLQERVKMLYNQHFLPVIERCCAAVDEPNRHIRLENIAIDIAVEDFLNPNADWLDTALKKLEKELMQALQTSANSAKSSSGNFSENLSSQNPSWGNFQSFPNFSSEHKSQNPPPQYFLEKKDISHASQNPQTELLAYFLSTGQLPWWADATDRHLINKTILELLEKQPQQALQLLLKWLNEDFYRTRFIQNVKNKTLILCCQMVVEAQGWAFFSNELKEDAAKIQSYSQRLTFWEDLLNEIFNEISSSGNFKGFSNFSSDQKSKNTPPQYFSSNSGNFQSSPNLVQDKPSEEATQNRPLLYPTHLSKNKHRNTPKQPPKTIKTDARLYVQNAGLVLLAPYLPLFFENLGWVSDKKFVDESKAAMAVIALQYLADGQEESPEFLLTLPKILCGFAPDALMISERLLDDNEKEEADSFLKAILENAPALGLKTPNALRGSFLLRQGVLANTENHWTLHIEVETYDLILNKISWNFQIIKLPWMKKPVFVDWALPQF